LNIGLGRNGTLTHIKQPSILPDSNVDRNPFVVSVSMLFCDKYVNSAYSPQSKSPFDAGLARAQNAGLCLCVDYLFGCHSGVTFGENVKIKQIGCDCLIIKCIEIKPM
jgi:hypothetical protein